MSTAIQGAESRERQTQDPLRGVVSLLNGQEILSCWDVHVGLGTVRDGPCLMFVDVQIVIPGYRDLIAMGSCKLL